MSDALDMDIYLYALIDPRDCRVRYIGRTVNPLQRRLREHLNTAKRGKLKDGRKAAWFAELESSAMVPIISLLRTADKATFQAVEKELIREYRERFPDLLNVRPGGDGGLGGHFVKWTPELEARLGKVADSTLANEMGITRKSVTYRRDQLSIPAAYDRTNNTPPPPMGGHNRIEFPPDVIAKFGKFPDHAIAAEFGCSKKAVTSRRNALGIPSYAAQTGNNGKIKSGEPHRRWGKHE